MKRLCAVIFCTVLIVPVFLCAMESGESEEVKALIKQTSRVVFVSDQKIVHYTQAEVVQTWQDLQNQHENYLELVYEHIKQDDSLRITSKEGRLIFVNVENSIKFSGEHNPVVRRTDSMLEQIIKRTLLYRELRLRARSCKAYEHYSKQYMYYYKSHHDKKEYAQINCERRVYRTGELIYSVWDEVENLEKKKEQYNRLSEAARKESKIYKHLEHFYKSSSLATRLDKKARALADEYCLFAEQKEFDGGLYMSSIHFADWLINRK